MTREVLDTEELRGWTIEISRDPDDEGEADPRLYRDLNMATLAFWHRRYTLGDEQIDTSEWENRAELGHSWGRCVAIAPIYAYEHGSLMISSKPFGDPWDSCPIGYGYITAERAEQCNATGPNWTPKRFLEVVVAEIDTYGNYIDGRIFQYRVLDPDGQLVAAAGGYLDWQQCKADAHAAARDGGDVMSYPGNRR